MAVLLLIAFIYILVIAFKLYDWQFPNGYFWVSPNHKDYILGNFVLVILHSCPILLATRAIVGAFKQISVGLHRCRGKESSRGPYILVPREE